MRDVAGVHDELRLHRHRIDRVDRRLERAGDVGVSRLMKADVAVADLHELCGRCSIGERATGEDAGGGERVGDTAPRPGNVTQEIVASHAFTSFTTIVPFMYGCSSQK